VRDELVGRVFVMSKSEDLAFRFLSIGWREQRANFYVDLAIGQHATLPHDPYT
jgi:hypothetical protein